MKKTKRNSALIVLVVLLLALAVGYAAFQQVLTISGTATAAGNWDVKFVDPTTITEGHGTASITGDAADTVTVNATLGFPGDGCTVTAHIKNAGTVPAKLTSLELLNADGSAAFADDDITITIPEVEGEALAAGETCQFTFAIAWDADSEAEQKEVGFQIKFTYDQNTTPVTVTPDHPTHTTN